MLSFSPPGWIAGGVVTLIIATRNAHKVAEIQAVLSDAFRYLTLNDFPSAPVAVEDANSFAGNATKKAVHLARWMAQSPLVLEKFAGTSADSEIYSVADDSGLEVDALQGAPGVHSARFAALDTGAAGNSSDASNNAKLLQLLKAVPAERRTARFRCCIALTPVLLAQPESASPVCYADEAELQTQLFEGVCEGRIGHGPRGTHGFGYDPLFVPDGFDQTFAELSADAKNRMSHRARALEKLREWFQ